MRSEGLISGLLYDGILSPQAWYQGLSAFNEAVGGFNFHQLKIDFEHGAVLESIASIRNDNQKAVEDYDRHYALIDERVPIVRRLGTGQIMLDHEHFDASHLSRSALYVDCLAPQGMKHTMGVMLQVEGGVYQCLGFMRHLDRPHFGDEDRQLAQRIVPDAIRAAQLRDRATHLAQQAALGLAALNTLPQGLAVIDNRRAIQYSNPAADRLLARCDVVRVRHGQLQCREAGADA